MKKLSAVLAGVMLVFTLSNSANALSINFTDGTISAMVTDDNSDGIITLSNYAFNGFSINFIGVRSSLPSDPTTNSLKINSFEITNTALTTKSLTVQISDNGYILNPVYPTTMNALATFGASGLGTATTATFTAYLGTNNTLFEKSTSLGQWGPLDLTGASSTILTPTTLSDHPFSLTEEILLTQESGTSASYNANVTVAPVPEPGTMVLLGAGLLGLAIYGKRRMNKDA